MPASTRPTDVDALARGLASASTWPEAEPGATVEWIQTHISHVFLVGDRVYKLRKDVRLSFLDFGTRARRNEDCVRELRLNRRLAPDVYRGIAPIVAEENGIRVGPIGEPPIDDGAEHVVVMRRLPEGCDALSMLEADRLEPRHLDAVADRLVRFHAEHGLGAPAPWSADAAFTRARDPVVACITALREAKVLDEARLDAIASNVEERLAALRPHFEARRVAGRAVDGHGDLHLDHVWFESDAAEPLMIDCIEFDDALRRIDRASEVAFLAMDLRYRGAPALAEAFLHAYACRADDYDLFESVDFHAAYRALVRAKVAAVAVGQASIAADQQARARRSVGDHVALAESLLEKPTPGDVLVVCGTVGSGKSTVALELARAGRGIPISSDRVRKALAGLPATSHPSSGADEGLYRPEEKDRVYEAMLERALPVVRSGRTAILDASHPTRARRDRVRAWAAEHARGVRLVEVRCDPDVARARLRERERRGDDASDAGPALLDRSRSRFEPPDEWPQTDREVVWSSARPDEPDGPS